MVDTVYRSFLPVTVLCAVLGLATVNYQRPVLSKLFTAYCWLWAVFLCAAFLFTAFVSVYVIEFTCIGVIVSVGGVMYMFVLFYYCMKYILDDEGDTLDNINFLDKKLESLGIKVPHRRNKIESLMLPIAYVLLNIIMSYKHSKYMVLRTAKETINLIGSTCFVVTGSVTYFYSAVLNIRIFILAYFLRQRLNLIRKALLNYDKPKIAWSDDRVVLRVISGNTRLNEDLNYFQTLILLYRCSFDTSQRFGSFYACFININVFITCLMYPVHLLFTIIEREDFTYAPTVILTLFVSQLRFIACISVSNELNRIHSLIYRVCYKQSRGNISKKTSYWLHKCGHYDTRFDCGFLYVDIAMFSIILDYIVLFLFAMLSSVRN